MTETSNQAEPAGSTGAANGAPLKLTSVDRIPTVWTEAPGPMIGALMFRVGRADETLTSAGVTHLVEHLALHPLGRPAYVYGGQVEDSRVLFHAQGDPDEVATFLRFVAASLRDLPLDRLEREKAVLRTEAQAQVSYLARSLRFGPQGYGLCGYREMGLHTITADQVSAWAQRWFTRENAALMLSGAPPDGLDLDLPDGEGRVPARAPLPVPELDLPAFHDEGDAQVAISFLGERSTTRSMATRLLAQRAYEDLRRERGISYGVIPSYEPLDSTTAHVLIQADCMAAQAIEARDGLLRAFDRLADEGPSESELADDVEAARRAWAQPGSELQFADAAAFDVLLERPHLTSSQLLAEMREVDPASVASALRDMADSMILTLPAGTPPPRNRFKRHGAGWGEYAASGRKYTPSSGPLGRKCVIDDNGITWSEQSTQRGIMFEDCVLVARDLGGVVTLVDRRGAAIRLNLSDGIPRDEILRELSERIPAEHWVDLIENVDERTESFEALVKERLKWWRRSVRREIEMLPLGLMEDEDPVDLAMAVFSDGRGLLALTERRLIYLGRAKADGSDQVIEIPLESIEKASSRVLLFGVWTIGARLDLEWEGEELTPLIRPWWAASRLARRIAAASSVQ